MDFELPTDVTAYLEELDRFIETEIKPLESENSRFFDHRREHARTDWDNNGLPQRDWEELLREMRRRADAAGHLRYALPAEVGGQAGSNLAMAVIREHLAAKGLGLHNDLQNESSIVGNFPTVLMVLDQGTEAQKEEFCESLIVGDKGMAFGLTEPDHGSDATHMDTAAVRDGDTWVINGQKRWITGMHKASHVALFARTSGQDGDAHGITCFIVPTDLPGIEVGPYWWTFNMPTDHPDVRLPMYAFPIRPFWATKDVGCRWRRSSFTKTAFARRPARWGRRSSASTRLWPMPVNALRSGRLFGSTRRSSFRWPSFTRKQPCYGR